VLKSEIPCLHYYHDLASITLGTYLKRSASLHISLHLITMPRNPAPSRQIETRVGNKTAHLGDVVKSHKRQTTAEVEAERLAKAQAKKDCKLAKKRSIDHVAQFECADTVWEDGFNATPCPAFTPKPRPQPRTNRFPTESSDVEMTDSGDFDGAPFIPHSTDSSVCSVTVDDPAVESDPPPPRKKVKANSAAKGKASKKVKGKAASKEKKGEESEVESVEPKAELPKVPKLKKKSFQDKVDVATKELEEAEAKKSGGGMMQEGEPKGNADHDDDSET
jgi:hypothetical protein